MVYTYYVEGLCMYVCMSVCSYCLTLWFCSVRKWLWKGCFLLRKSRPSPWQHCSCTSSHCVVSSTSNRRLPQAYEAASGRGWWREGMEGKGVGHECCMVNYKYSNIFPAECLMLSSLVVSLSVKLHCNDALHMQHTGMHSFSGTHIHMHTNTYIQCICTYVCGFLAYIFFVQLLTYISWTQRDTHIHAVLTNMCITGANTCIMYLRTYVLYMLTLLSRPAQMHTVCVLCTYVHCTYIRINSTIQTVHVSHMHPKI